MAADAALEAVVLCSDGVISNRMKLQVMFPEMNPQMDSYRIGTLLELVSTGLRVRIAPARPLGITLSRFVFFVCLDSNNRNTAR